MDKVNIYCDGASRGNPGPAAIGVIVKDREGRTLTSISRRIGLRTNNQAEYQAVIAGLEVAQYLGVRQVNLFCDSELVTRQLKGEYRVKNITLKPLYQLVRGLADRLEDFRVSYIPRHRNKEADNLANMAF
jgi:ribonuclease HI